ncbi:TRAP transporter small permease subunit [Roseospira goensis]|uniref:TRAP transporter small permease protein n=1 Tax=Roseospira goensis TaxID=391922 RepID=A0A7W6S0I2_9PROT|nr:TRAP transporter small permease subunit [Roseospira goensis]MBB4286640.1 TRAP-type mannitol/chloroaromatic compound transport system permease small subunit [Roseospira goensis]
MPKAIRHYVRVMDATSRITGRLTMLLIFAMMAVLFWSAVSKNTPGLLPSIWTLEVAQFLMVTYFLVGGAYALQTESHVRMDLLYGMWSRRTKTWVDVFTIFFLIFYLSVLLYGGLSSTSYALEYGERSYSAWRPYMAPIKIIMCLGITLTLLQAFAELFKDIARLRGERLGEPAP